MNRLVLIALILSLVGISARAERMRQIKVREVQGKVLAWEPWDSSWVPVEAGFKLWESTLVQVSEGATVTFTLDAKEGFNGLQADTVDVTLNKPVVLRLDGNVLRKVQLSTFFIPQMPDVTQSGTSTKKELFKGLNEAWERFAAVVMPGAVKASFLEMAMSEDKDDATLAARSKKINLVTPRDGMLAMAERLPLELTVLWKPIEDKNALYEVMIWKMDEPRRPPLGITRYDYHYARLYSEGTYYVQVGTQDGRWQSKVHQVHVSLPLEGRPSGSVAGGSSTTRPLPLMAPPEHFRYVADKIPASITFAWERGDSRAPQNYTLTLMDGSGRELMKKTTNERTLRVRLNRPGAYRWQIEASPQSATKTSRRHFSEVREFRLDAAIDLMKPGRDLVTEVILGQANGVYYLEKGF